MKKLYFENDDSEMCFPETYFQHLMKENGLSEIEVLKAKKYKLDNVFWCKEFQEIGQTGSKFTFDQCGHECKSYLPRNGKSGCCKHYSKTFYEPDEKIILKLKNNERTI